MFCHFFKKTFREYSTKTQYIRRYNLTEMHFCSTVMEVKRIPQLVLAIYPPKYQFATVHCILYQLIEIYRRQEKNRLNYVKFLENCRPKGCD